MTLGYGLSTLVKGIAEEHVAAGMAATEYRVHMITLAALLDDLGDQEVHFLKIDVFVRPLSRCGSR
jgi:hypothetical protein